MPTFQFSFQDQENLYFVLEYVPYCLNNFIRVGGLPIDIVRFYSAQILCALEYLHTEMDLVHRDLKPGNIMVTERDYIKLVSYFYH